MTADMSGATPTAFPVVERNVNGVQLQVFDYGPRTFRDVAVATLEHGDKTAVVYFDERITYAQQWERIVAVANALTSELGVVRGDTVSIAMRNLPEWIVAFWATQLVGAVCVPLNSWFTAEELAVPLRDARPKVVFVDDERVARVRGGCEITGIEPVLVGVRAAAEQATAGGIVSFDALVASAAGQPLPPDPGISDLDPSTILYTSGTTGRPKGAVGSNLNHTASLLNKLPGIGGGNRPATKLITFPFFHIGGINIVSTAQFAGHTLVLMHKWDVDEAIRLIDKESVTEISGAPHVIATLLDRVQRDGRTLPSLRNIAIGGASAPPQMILDIGTIFAGRVMPRTGYGLTETTAATSAIDGQDYLDHPESVGKPLATTDIRFLDEDGDDVVPGETGEIALYGPQVFPGYHLAPEATAASVQEGWFRTGDLGRMDEEGYIYVVGRIKDMVIRGGENVYCAEVENVLVAHPDILEVGVVGIPHPTLGEEVCAVVRARDGAVIVADTVTDFAGGRLASFKIPSRIVVVDEPLPRTPTGKLLKVDLRRLAEAR